MSSGQVEEEGPQAIYDVLRTTVQNQKKKNIRLQRTVDMLHAEIRKLRELMEESGKEQKEMIEFLQDEKTILAESVTKAETEVKTYLG
jgi:hypothetical protein